LEDFQVAAVGKSEGFQVGPVGKLEGFQVGPVGKLEDFQVGPVGKLEDFQVEAQQLADGKAASPEDFPAAAVATTINIKEPLWNAISSHCKQA
jgi:hypothetical protein